MKEIQDASDAPFVLQELSEQDQVLMFDLARKYYVQNKTISLNEAFRQAINEWIEN